MNAAILRPSRSVVFVSVLVLTLGGCASRSWHENADPQSRRREGANVITARDIELYPQAMSVEELIARLVPGLVLTNTRGQVALVMMGFAANRTAEPLFVVDGIPLPASNGRLGLNTHDIERIEVLKEGGALSQYGFRGSNGVIVITTKRGNR